jgi:hypothetical protein
MENTGNIASKYGENFASICLESGKDLQTSKPFADVRENSRY